MKQLWTREEPFDFEGRFYKIKKGYLEPKPIQRPFPAVMNAGGSERGQHFAAKYCDVVYVVFGSHDFDDARPRSILTAISRARNTAARSRCGATPTWCRATPKRKRRTITTTT